MSGLTLTFEGPMQWLEPGTSDYLFAQPAAREPGLYVWTVLTNAGEYAYYVGETRRNLSTRHEEHLLAYLSGLYRVYDADRFQRHEKHLIWPGMWQAGGIRHASRFLDEMPIIAERIRAFLQLLRIYLAPLDTEHRLRRRIEAALARALSMTDSNLQEPDIRYDPRKDQESPVEVRLAPRLDVSAWPEVLAV